MLYSLVTTCFGLQRTGAEPMLSCCPPLPTCWLQTIRTKSARQSSEGEVWPKKKAELLPAPNNGSSWHHRQVDGFSMHSTLHRVLTSPSSTGRQRNQTDTRICHLGLVIFWWTKVFFTNEFTNTSPEAFWESIINPSTLYIMLLHVDI